MKTSTSRKIPTNRNGRLQVFLHGWSAAKGALGLAVAAKSGGGEAERNRGQAGTAARLSPVGMRGGDASSASQECGLARELLGNGRKGTCDCVG